jgi:hypothetical protein
VFVDPNDSFARAAPEDAAHSIEGSEVELRDDVERVAYAGRSERVCDCCLARRRLRFHGLNLGRSQETLEGRSD